MEEFNSGVKDGIPYVDYRTRVRYGETDKMKVGYYGNYAVWFEAGRSTYGRVRDMPYSDFEEQGYYAVVAELYCRYINSVRYDDEIIVRTSITEVTRRTVKFEYEVFLAESMKLCATGYTKHVCISKDGRVTGLPDKWLALKDRLKKRLD